MNRWNNNKILDCFIIYWNFNSSSPMGRVFRLLSTISCTWPIILLKHQIFVINNEKSASIVVNYFVHVANYSSGHINTWPMHYQLTAGRVCLSVWPCISHTLCIWIIHDPPPLCHRSPSISEYPVLQSPGKRGKYNMLDEDSMCYWEVNALFWLAVVKSSNTNK